MKKLLAASSILRFLVSATFTIHLAAPLARGQTAGCTEQSLTLAEEHLTDTIRYINTSQFATSTDPTNSNKWTAVDARDWTSGFFPGWIWYMYEKTLSDFWMTRAKAQTESLQNEDTNASDHDIGFKILASYGNGYRITRDPSYLSVIQTAAKSLSTLYRSGAGVIESWPNFDGKVTVIIDNMMNLELLFFAAQSGGDPSWHNMAVSHALKTMQNHVRADGSTYQVVDYNTDGTVYRQFTVQGAGTETTWSRGQAWGDSSGFTMTYRYTKDARFLITAGGSPTTSLIIFQRTMFPIPIFQSAVVTRAILQPPGHRRCWFVRVKYLCSYSRGQREILQCRLEISRRRSRLPAHWVIFCYRWHPLAR